MESVYYLPEAAGSFTSAGNLAKYSSNTLHDARDYLESQDAYTLHKPIRRKFPRRQVVSLGIDRIWQLDLADLTNISRHNDNYKFILTCIDCYSRYAFAVPVKNKSAPEVKSAFETILTKSDRSPTYVQTDKGREFLNAIFFSFLKQRSILHYTSENNDIKCAIVERFNRTLKSKMWRYFTYSKTLRYIEVLPKLMQSYNTTHHSSIKIAPNRMDRHYEDKVEARRKSVTYKFTVGDSVRISRTVEPFRKGYEGAWSKEVFIVSSRHPTNPPTYTLKDYSGEVVKGKFYVEELQRVKRDPSLFEVERVVRTRTRKGKKEYLVRWMGYGPKHDTWVDDLVL
jgi:hypothetical protein